LLILEDLLKDFEIIHQTGEDNFKNVKAEADVVMGEESKKYYHPIPFLNENDLASAFSAADLIISRAGAGSIFEIAALGKPSILVPLPGSAQNHQLKNAYAYAENGASIVIEELNFTPRFLLEKLKYLFSKPQKLREMAKKAGEFAKPESARIIAEYLIAYLKQ
jgi:UDP-N-acetylglucosamine--N-acetylmuramyl-(pentapeptide) pyrophosphoryl-undecaprenol N-acetylglucosamine transferase